MYCNKGLLNERSLLKKSLFSGAYQSRAYVKQLAPIGSAKEEAMHASQADVKQGSELAENVAPENVVLENAGMDPVIKGLSGETLL